MLKNGPKLIDLSLKDYKLIFESIKNKEFKVFFCGNFGDALASLNFDEIFDYLINETKCNIAVVTNGSLRSPEWWADFAKKGQDRLRVTFSIDGLSDTNHIYRKGSSWQLIMENAKAFTSQGGWAKWDFIEFRHNYMQKENARDLAKKIGFKEFNFKYTARFASETGELNIDKNKTSAINRETNKNKNDFVSITRKFGSFDEYVNKTKITCKTQKDKSIFFDMYMRVWPCCWFGEPLYSKTNLKETKSFLYLEKKYGENFNSFLVHGWDVLEQPFFKEYLSKSWDSPNDDFKRVYTCGRTCGQGFESSSGYGKNTNKEKL
jgi:MoaA/NifB/PqqE/SkfB family radical SAM enzyme